MRGFQELWTQSRCFGSCDLHMWLFSVNFALENHGSGIRVSFLGSIAEGKNNREPIFRRKVLTTKEPIADCFRDCFRLLFEWQTRSVRNNGSRTRLGQIRWQRNTVMEGGRYARGGCNLYYPSTISVERIEGARITVITTDTRNNIMRDASCVSSTSGPGNLPFKWTLI